MNTRVILSEVEGSRRATFKVTSAGFLDPAAAGPALTGGI